MKIYWAGPLFTLAERLWNVEMVHVLEKDKQHTIWLPQNNEPRDKTVDSIFKMDVEGIDWADVVVAVMDGPDPDSGTCWECGYAYAKGKPVITVRTDFRNNGDMPMTDGSIESIRYNLMLHASATERIYIPFQNQYEVANKIALALEKLRVSHFSEQAVVGQ